MYYSGKFNIEVISRQMNMNKDHGIISGNVGGIISGEM